MVKRRFSKILISFGINAVLLACIATKSLYFRHHQIDLVIYRGLSGIELASLCDPKVLPKRVPIRGLFIRNADMFRKQLSLSFNVPNGK